MIDNVAYYFKRTYNNVHAACNRAFDGSLRLGMKDYFGFYQSKLYNLKENLVDEIFFG